MVSTLHVRSVAVLLSVQCCAVWTSTAHQSSSPYTATAITAWTTAHATMLQYGRMHNPDPHRTHSDEHQPADHQQQLLPAGTRVYLRDAVQRDHGQRRTFCLGHPWSVRLIRHAAESRRDGNR